MNTKSLRGVGYHLPLFLYTLFLNLYTVLRYEASGITLVFPFVLALYGSLVLLPFSIRKIRVKTYLILTIPFFVISILHLFHWVRFDFTLTPGAMISMVFSNTGETFEFLKTIPHLWKGLFVVIIFCYLFLFSFYRNDKIELKKNGYFFILIFFLLLGLKSFRSKTLDLSFTRYGINTFFKDAYTAYGEFQKLTHLKEQLPSPFKIVLNEKRSGQNEIHIIVIGESARRANWGLYGYGRNTNPFIKDQKGLIVFKDVVTGGQVTIQALLKALSFDDESITILDVLKKAGFKTYWLSNQAKIGIYDTPISAIGDKANNALYINTGMRSRSLDERLLPHLKNAIMDKGEKSKVIFLHLMGSHSEFDLRVPQDFSTFSGNAPRSDISTSSKDIWNRINQYDTTIKYTDKILSDIIELIKKNNISTLTYFSDHGITLFEDGSTNVLPGNAKMKKIQAEIPFIFWGSEEYSRLYKKRVDKLNTLSNQALSLSDFENFLLFILGARVEIDGELNSTEFEYNNGREIQTITGETVIYEGLN